MTHEFFIPMQIPTVTQQEHKITTRGKQPHLYEPAELKAARLKLRDHLAQHRPERPLVGPLSLSTGWGFYAGDKHAEGEWKTTPPDTDNLVKMLKDEMTKLHFWMDDAQVCAERIVKSYSNTAVGLYVRIAELEGENEPE